MQLPQNRLARLHPLIFMITKTEGKLAKSTYANRNHVSENALATKT